ncbi:MAG: hypothetical protein L0Z53_24640, partial [Acidobacteriales bacterium]|nr:hypothetical protein [Terriglobales bacterium]
LLKRYREEVEKVLPLLSARLLDEEHVRRIEACRHTEDPGKLKDLLSELREQLAEKTPDEKLNLLLESLKAYCSNEEYLECRDQSFVTLREEGFRAARQQVVEMHKQFRLRAQELDRAQQDSGPHDKQDT